MEQKIKEMQEDIRLMKIEVAFMKQVITQALSEDVGLIPQLNNKIEGLAEWLTLLGGGADNNRPLC